MGPRVRLGSCKVASETSVESAEIVKGQIEGGVSSGIQTPRALARTAANGPSGLAEAAPGGFAGRSRRAARGRPGGSPEGGISHPRSRENAEARRETVVGATPDVR